MSYNLPNLLTYSRIAAIPVIIGCLFVPKPLGNWLAFSFYTYACVTDFFDGYLARAWQQQSSLGRVLDPIADKLLVAAVLLTLVADARVEGLSIVAAAVILCREILVSGLREFLAEVRVGLPVSALAKWKTAIQMLALGFLIVGDVGPRLIWFETIEVGIGGLWIAAILTLVTGYDYLRASLAHIHGIDRAPKSAPRATERPGPPPSGGERACG